MHMYTNKPFSQLTFHQQSEKKQVLSDEVTELLCGKGERVKKTAESYKMLSERQEIFLNIPPPCLIARSILDQGTVIKKYGLLI